MKPLKSISLTLTELQSLMGIDSPAERQQAIDYVTSAMENPEQVNPADVAAEHPAVQAFARRIHRRVRAAQKRATRRQKDNPALSRPSLSERQADTLTTDALTTDTPTTDTPKKTLAETAYTVEFISINDAHSFCHCVKELRDNLRKLVDLLRKMYCDRAGNVLRFLSPVYQTIRDYAAVVEYEPYPTGCHFSYLTL